VKARQILVARFDVTGLTDEELAQLEGEVGVQGESSPADEWSPGHGDAPYLGGEVVDLVAAAAAVVEAEGNDFSYGKPDERDFVRMVQRGAGRPEWSNDEPLIDVVANDLHEEGEGGEIQSAEDLATFVLDRLDALEAGESGRLTDAGYENPRAYDVPGSAYARPVVGARVRLRHDEDRYPHFVARAGSLGTVTESGDDLVAVRLDEPLEGAEEWSNEVHWYPSNDDREPDVEVLP
jgi:hypothetical protein